jgi:hypothetical protein
MIDLDTFNETNEVLELEHAVQRLTSLELMVNDLKTKLIIRHDQIVELTGANYL